MDVAAISPGAPDTTSEASEFEVTRAAHFPGGFTMVRNELIDLAMPHLSDYAFRMALFIERWTTGYKQQSETTLSLRQMASAIGCALSSAQRASEELQALRIIQVRTEGRGRGSRTIWRLTPAATWITTQKNVPMIGTLKSAAKNVPMGRYIKPKNVPTVGTIEPINVPIQSDSTYKKKRDIKKEKKEIPAVAAEAPPSAPRQRKTTDEEQTYIRHVFELVKPHRRMPDGAKREAEVSAIRRMYKLSPRPSPEQIALYYSIEITRPRWEADGLHINHLERGLGAYLKSPPGFKARIERERKGANGDYDRQTPPPTPSPRPRKLPPVGVIPMHEPTSP